MIALSRHKFSSNVIEKCLRCSADPSREMIINEILAPGEIERLLRDSFANYVIQTALDYATPIMKHRLVETIRPCLPSIRATPYGRRIQAKIQAYDTRNGTSNTGQVTPTDPSSGQISLRPTHNRTMSNNASILAAPAAFANGLNGLNGTHANGVMFPSSAIVAVPPPQAQAPPQPPRTQQFPPQYPPLGAATENGETQWV
jgi:hypothetical protein